MAGGATIAQRQQNSHTGPRRLAERDFTSTNSTGTTISVKNIEEISPTAITLASGLHKLDPEIIMGVTPTAAAIVVRKMGRRRRSPASMAALSSELPSRSFSFDVIDQDDGVPHDDSGERDHAGEGREAERIAREQQPQHGAEHGERNRAHHQQRLGEIAELHQQHQEDGDQADGQRFGHHGQGLAAIGDFAAVVETVAVGKREGLHLRVDGVQNLGGIVAALRKGAHRQRADAVAAHDAAGLPGGRERGDRAQRDAGVGDGGRHVGVAHVLERIAARRRGAAGWSRRGCLPKTCRSARR
jgi:hypothetical protein